MTGRSRLAVEDGQSRRRYLRPFGVKTIRVTCVAAAAGGSRRAGQAGVGHGGGAVLAGRPGREPKSVSHYHVYRGTQPDFQPSLLNLVQRPAGTLLRGSAAAALRRLDQQPLEPDTTYYYRVSAVDRWNNEGPASPPVAVTTLKATDKNMIPLQVACLRAVLVSPLSRFNVVNLLWRTNCESDVRKYEIHRSSRRISRPSDTTRLPGRCRVVLKGGTAYGQTPIDYRLGEFDHPMYHDKAVEPTTTYYYRVAAIGRRTAGCIFGRGLSVDREVSGFSPARLCTAREGNALRQPPQGLQ